MISKLAMLAKKTIEAAWLHGESYDLATQAAEALESAQLLQSPETAAARETEPDRLTRTFAPTQALRNEGPTETAELVIYRATWDTMRLGRYTTEAEARKHCEDHARRDLPTASFDWIEDEEDGVSELVASVGEDERPTGYEVTALEIASKYDPGADE
ncbi:hypothetical protein ACFWWT_04295 [Streptomyces sp. NPDC058676]|uniref:hypothetical protein n=1 Tax=Streptomyces sp. NPDC058676 TaxID=3346593 RepID=UPI00364EEE3E